MPRLAVERDRARAVARPRLQVLLHLETRRALLFDNGHRAVALRAERLHRLRVERGAVGAAGEGQPLEDLPVLGAEDDEPLLRVRRIDRRASRTHDAARREQNLMLRVKREPVASAVLAEWIR